MKAQIDFPLFESIRYHNGCFERLEWHQKRMQYAQIQLFAKNNVLDLKVHLQQFLPEDNRTYKCRMMYGKTLAVPEFIPYTIKPIRSLRLVKNDAIEYGFKFTDRSAINGLFELRGMSDDVLIVRQGFITDTSYCNIVFGNETDWFTPDKPLLEGTQRAFLLANGVIKTKEITLENLSCFSHFKLINAMIPWDEATINSIDSIRKL